MTIASSAAAASHRPKYATRSPSHSNPLFRRAPRSWWKATATAHGHAVSIDYMRVVPAKAARRRGPINTVEAYFRGIGGHGFPLTRDDDGRQFTLSAAALSLS